MHNERAKFLIEKGNLKEEDKKFLNTHLDVYEELVQSLKAEILHLKDVIDYTKALDNQILKVKEKLSGLEDCENKEQLMKKFQQILNFIELVEGKPNNY